MGKPGDHTVSVAPGALDWAPTIKAYGDPCDSKIRIPATGYYTSDGNTFFTYNWEAPVHLKAKQFGVIAVNGSSVVSAHDSEAEASGAAARLAAKDGNEYLVIKPLKIVRQKPVDIEEVVV